MSFENLILAKLQSTPGVVPRADLLFVMYGTKSGGMMPAPSNVLEVIVARIRRKLGKERVKTHRGVGYSWEAES
jgi:DNA-binding response OmpR family regulator